MALIFRAMNAVGDGEGTAINRLSRNWNVGIASD